MRLTKLAMLLALALVVMVPASAAVIIDPYTDGQFNGFAGSGSFNYASVNVGLFNRVIGVTQTLATTGTANTSILSSGGLLTLSVANNTDADWVLTYTTGSPVDLSAMSGFLFSAASDLGYSLGFQVNGQNSSTSVLVPSGNVTGNFGVGFASFAGVNWANVTSIVISANGSKAASDLDLSPLVAGVPEPSTYALMGAGLLALAGLARRRKA